MPEEEEETGISDALEEFPSAAPKKAFEGDPEEGEPLLEVNVYCAELAGIFDSANEGQYPFVEIWEDAEEVAETTVCCTETGDWSEDTSVRPTWKSRFLFRPNGTEFYRFRVCIDHKIRNRTIVGEAGFAGADVWKTVGTVKCPVALSVMLLRGGHTTGVLHLVMSMYNPERDKEAAEAVGEGSEGSSSSSSSGSGSSSSSSSSSSGSESGSDSDSEAGKGFEIDIAAQQKKLDKEMKESKKEYLSEEKAKMERSKADTVMKYFTYTWDQNKDLIKKSRCSCLFRAHPRAGKDFYHKPKIATLEDVHEEDPSHQHEDPPPEEEKPEQPKQPALWWTEHPGGPGAFGSMQFRGDGQYDPYDPYGLAAEEKRRAKEAEGDGGSDRPESAAGFRGIPTGPLGPVGPQHYYMGTGSFATAPFGTAPFGTSPQSVPAGSDGKSRKDKGSAASSDGEEPQKYEENEHQIMMDNIYSNVFTGGMPADAGSDDQVPVRDTHDVKSAWQLKVPSTLTIFDEPHTMPPKRPAEHVEAFQLASRKSLSPADLPGSAPAPGSARSIDVLPSAQLRAPSTAGVSVQSGFATGAVLRPPFYSTPNMPPTEYGVSPMAMPLSTSLPPMPPVSSVLQPVSSKLPSQPFGPGINSVSPAPTWNRSTGPPTVLTSMSQVPQEIMNQSFGSQGSGLGSFGNLATPATGYPPMPVTGPMQPPMSAGPGAPFGSGQLRPISSSLIAT